MLGSNWIWLSAKNIPVGSERSKQMSSEIIWKRSLFLSAYTSRYQMRKWDFPCRDFGSKNPPSVFSICLWLSTWTLVIGHKYRKCSYWLSPTGIVEAFWWCAFVTLSCLHIRNIDTVSTLACPPLSVSHFVWPNPLHNSEWDRSLFRRKLHFKRFMMTPPRVEKGIHRTLDLNSSRIEIYLSSQ